MLLIGRSASWSGGGGGAYSQNFVDNNGTAYFTSGGVADSAFMTFSAWVKENHPVSAYIDILFEQQARTQIGINGGKLHVILEDNANVEIYDAISNSPQFGLGELKHIYVAVDLTVPSVTIEIDGTNHIPNMTINTALSAGTGSLHHSRNHGILATALAANVADVQVSDFFVDCTQVLANTNFWNGGTPQSLVGIGSPRHFLGDTMTADARAGNTAQGWNDGFNIGSATLTVGSATFTDV